MKIRSVVAFVGLAISLALPTFAQQKETVDPKILEQLDADGKKFAEACDNNDAAAVAALFTEDAIFVTDTGPIYGREAIEKQYAEWFKGAHASDTISKRDPNSVRVVGTADNIASSGEWSQTWQAQGQKPVHIKGYWSVIDTRVGDAWRICVLTNNKTPAPAATASPTASPSNK